MQRMSAGRVPYKAVMLLFPSIVMFAVCACSPVQPQIIVSKIEFEASSGRDYSWSILTPDGRVVGTGPGGVKTLFVNEEERLIPLERTDEILAEAQHLVQENPKTWQESVLWLNKGEDRLIINFASYRHGARMLPVSWPSGQNPQNEQARRLLELLFKYQGEAPLAGAICTTDALAGQDPQSIK